MPNALMSLSYGDLQKKTNALAIPQINNSNPPSFWDFIGALQLTGVPVVSDVASGALAARDLYNSDYKSASLNALGVLPFIPGLGGVTVFAPNAINKSSKQYADVINQMKLRGAPEIRAIYDGEAYQALEGSHRLAAAKELGIDPIIKEVKPRSWFTDHDLYDLPDKTSAARAMDYLVKNRDASYVFENLK